MLFHSLIVMLNFEILVGATALLSFEQPSRTIASVKLVHYFSMGFPYPKYSDGCVHNETRAWLYPEGVHF